MEENLVTQKYEKISTKRISKNYRNCTRTAIPSIAASSKKESKWKVSSEIRINFIGTQSKVN